MTLPVIGPLWLPASNSGVNDPNCTHVAPRSCSKCDGSRLTGAEHDRAPLPPCMRPPINAEEAS